MAAVHIRNLPEETHRALKARAARNKRSTESEIRAILEDAVRPKERVLLGSAMAAISRHAGLVNADIEALKDATDTSAAKPFQFE